jgi:hypothetical protein
MCLETIIPAFLIHLAPCLQKVIAEAELPGAAQQLSSSSYTTIIDRMANIFR